MTALSQYQLTSYNTVQYIGTVKHKASVEIDNIEGGDGL